MSVNATVLFGIPQSEIATMISSKLATSVATSIVTGFATPGGISAIEAPIKARPHNIETIIVGASTYPGFLALDELLAAGVPTARLFVHLGHTRVSGGNKNPFVRYHPMLHSKIYYMDHGDGSASAIVGSHNVTSFALTGLNGEASVLLEGSTASAEFQKIRQHIASAQLQSVHYSPDLKEAFAWWTREYLDGMKAEVKIPVDWTTVRTVLIFATIEGSKVPVVGDEIYFELPAGIEEIETLKTEVHVFVFDSLPADPWDAVNQTGKARFKLTCMTQGAENKRGNLEVIANCQIQNQRNPRIVEVPGGSFRPIRNPGMQQVRCDVQSLDVPPFDYLFDRERTGWDPILSDDDILQPAGITGGGDAEDVWFNPSADQGWKLVTGLHARGGIARMNDEVALRLAAPESGFFILVSLRRRKRHRRRNRDRNQ